MNKLMVMAAMVAALVIPARGWSAQASQAPSASQSPSAQQAQEPAPTNLQTAQGTLVQVNDASQMLSIKQSDGKQMSFRYDSQTQVTGAEKTVEGLAKKSGTQLSIQYDVTGGSSHAVKIDVQ